MGAHIVYVFNLFRLIFALVQIMSGSLFVVFQFGILILLLLFLIFFGCLEFDFTVIDICNEIACRLLIVVMCSYHLLWTN